MENIKERGNLLTEQINPKSENLDQLTSSRFLEKPFKRTISRLYELTSEEYN